MATEQTQRKRTSWTRILLIGVAVLVFLLGAVAFLFPYILKRYIESHGEEWIGRHITIDHIILNPFTYTYAVVGVRCTERGSGETFVSWKRVAVKADLWRGFRAKNWRFRALRIEEPYFHLVQHGDKFNFSDLIEMGRGGATSSTDTGQVRFAMEDIRVSGGRIDYASNLLKAPVGIMDLHAECDQITSESARMNFNLGLSIRGGGALNGGFIIDTQASEYAIRADLHGLALPLLLPYLQDLLHTTALRGTLGMTLDLHDSWVHEKALAASGQLELNQLEITDAVGGPLVGLAHGRIMLDTLNAASGSFKLSQMVVDGLHTRFQQWADGSNTWTKALRFGGAETGSGDTPTAAPANVFVMLADYVRELGQGFVANEYTADSMVLANGQVEFEDFTPEMPFRCTLDKVDIRSSRITSANGTADFTASARLNQSGTIHSSFKFDPMNFHNVEATMDVNGLSLPGLDPYSRWYGAYPIQSGTLSYKGSTNIQGGRIDSRNHLVADDLRFGKKTAIHDKDIIVLPLRLAASLLRDVHGVIDLDVPVKGDLNDPEFKPWPIVWQVLKNLVAKAAAAPVRLVAGLFGGGDVADMEEVRFAPLQHQVGKDQARALAALAETLKAKTDLDVSLVPLADVRQEREEWAAYLAKKDFLAQVGGPLVDSSRVMEMSLRDSAFTAYLDYKVPATKGMPERDRCIAVIGAELVAKAMAQAETSRQQATIAQLAKNGVNTARIHFRAASPEEQTGHMGVPGYRFVMDVSDSAQEPPQGTKKTPAVR